MSAQPSWDGYGMDPSHDVDDILAWVEARQAEQTARLDHEDQLDREARERLQAANAELSAETEEKTLLAAFEAAGLAEAGFDPGWDWRTVLHQNGFDEQGNPTKAPRPGVTDAARRTPEAVLSG